jgi:putative transposase
MARPLHIEFPNAFFHVASRGINRQDLFLDEEDRLVFIRMLRKVTFQFDLRLFAFCLMTNHYHLYLSTPNANLSKAIKSLNHRFALYFLAKYQDKDGKVFKPRFMRRLVEDNLYSLNLIAYVHNNPYKLVEEVSSWKYSSYPSYLGLQKDFDFIDYNWVWAQFANSTKSFVDFHELMRKTEWNPEKHTIANTFIASEDFAIKMAKEYLDLDLIDQDEIIGLKNIKKLNRNLDLDKLEQAVSAMKLGKRTALKLQIHFRSEYFHELSSDLAKDFKMSRKNVSLVNQRFKQELDKCKVMHRRMKELLKMLNAET